MTDQPVGQHAAVKRARSNSVESASSSASNKRNSPSVALAAMDLSNDAATSASASAVGGGSSDSSGSSSSDATQPLLSLSSDGEVGQSPTADLVDGKVQLDMVLPTLKQPLSEGDKWFIVDRNWFRKWQAACGGAVDDKGLAEITMQEVGPIDNSRIANPRNGKLTTTVAENENVVFLPGMAWHLLEKWYTIRVSRLKLVCTERFMQVRSYWRSGSARSLPSKRRRKPRPLSTRDIHFSSRPLLFPSTTFTSYNDTSSLRLDNFKAEGRDCSSSECERIEPLPALAPE